MTGYHMPKNVAVFINGRIYDTIAEASRLLDMSPQGIYSRLNSESPEWQGWIYVAEEKNVDVPKKLFIPCMYVVTHIPTGSIYVGSTGEIMGRKATHISALENGTHVNQRWSTLWESDKGKPMSDVWRWECSLYETRQQAYEAEQKLLSQLKGSQLLLNLDDDLHSPTKTIVVSPQSKVRSSAATARALKTLTAEDRNALVQKRVEALTNRWTCEDNRKAWKGAGNPAAKRIYAEGVIYGSMKDAQIALSLSEKVIRKRARSSAYPAYTFDICPYTGQPMTPEQIKLRDGQ